MPIFRANKVGDDLYQGQVDEHDKSHPIPFGMMRAELANAGLKDADIEIFKDSLDVAGVAEIEY